jgi:hypothetical protein
LASFFRAPPPLSPARQGGGYIRVGSIAPERWLRFFRPFIRGQAAAECNGLASFFRAPPPSNPARQAGVTFRSAVLHQSADFVFSRPAIERQIERRDRLFRVNKQAGGATGKQPEPTQKPNRRGGAGQLQRHARRQAKQGGEGSPQAAPLAQYVEGHPCLREHRRVQFPRIFIPSKRAGF